MENANQNPVLSFDAKRNAAGVPAQIVDYREDADEFTIAPDERYFEEGRDTDYIDFEPFNVPACAIGAFTRFNENDDNPSPHDLVGQYIVIPFP